MVWVEARILEHEAVRKRSSNSSAGRDHLGFNWNSPCEESGQPGQPEVTRSKPAGMKEEMVKGRKRT